MSRFAPEYVKCVLNDNFEDAESPVKLSADEDPPACAHLVILAERNIVPLGEARAIRDTLDSISQEDVRKTPSLLRLARISSFHVEQPHHRYLRRGSSPAGCTPLAAATRIDIDDVSHAAARVHSRSLLCSDLDLRRSLLSLAARHRETIFAVHTHTQWHSGHNRGALPARRSGTTRT